MMRYFKEFRICRRNRFSKLGKGFPVSVAAHNCVYCDETFHTEHIHTMDAQRGSSFVSLLIMAYLVTVTCAISPGGLLALKAFGKLGPDFLSSLLSGGLLGLISSPGDDKMDTILEKLQEIERELGQVHNSIEELKALSTRSQAEQIESRLMGYFERLMTITKAVKTYHDNKTEQVINDTATELSLQRNIDALKTELHDVPDLLYSYHRIIIGKTVSSGGSSPGLACYFIRHITSKYNVKEILVKEYEFRGSLMKLQAQSFQLYKSTCTNHDLVCNESGNAFETHLEAQEKRFRECLLYKLEQKYQNTPCPTPSAATMLSVNSLLAPLVLLIIVWSRHRLL
ncbi:uncharacterized protein LOC124111342 isoform X1 [Haliotis rufescens]|uniref:uncharacterized protein LOC124111342 isoform X2 n=1 Tax=Haliotis rufescens TaxID=6454 RepID=UPI00201EF934|nr:uncharacterized protein LOC124111342 isoform X2 [Haliotis rufescens]XP_048252109.1 uncharacterized protein LOC124111342 isoform X1 [Haliotis rufescens]